MAAWSDLTFDVLEYITSFLPLPDHYRFGAVCKNWRSVSKQRRHPPAPQLPWLVLEDAKETNKRKFYSLSEAKHYSLDVPELHGRYICGSSHGWLFAVDLKITGILINPFTRECYELPPLPAYTRRINVTTLIEKVPDDYNGGPIGLTFEEIQPRYIFKAILSHDPKETSDFTAMILFGEMHESAFWRPGDSSWTVIDGPRGSMDDILYFKGNFYAVSPRNKIYVVDFEPEPKLIKVGPKIPLENGVESCGIQRYLIDFNGHMLLIERTYKSDEKARCITDGFIVIEPKLEQNCYNICYDIDGYALFLGRNACIHVDSCHLPKCKKNGIYFTHPNESLSPKKFGFHDLGVFDMTDKTMGTFYSVDVFFPCIDSPVWITPNPW
ncbi:F-box family protein [Rhynchospora pubera]|uniref:F-box family protein n=1 Tax=Rhynchospora pubera TaxID=906938 RepID=A0AAV8GXP3_9POAL|nr:F-box family protein [Rhynchospora pubera]